MHERMNQPEFAWGLVGIAVYSRLYLVYQNYNKQKPFRAGLAMSSKLFLCIYCDSYTVYKVYDFFAEIIDD